MTALAAGPSPRGRRVACPLFIVAHIKIDWAIYSSFTISSSSIHRRGVLEQGVQRARTGRNGRTMAFALTVAHLARDFKSGKCRAENVFLLRSQSLQLPARCDLGDPGYVRKRGARGNQVTENHGFLQSLDAIDFAGQGHSSEHHNFLETGSRDEAGALHGPFLVMPSNCVLAVADFWLDTLGRIRRPAQKCERWSARGSSMGTMANSAKSLSTFMHNLQALGGDSVLLAELEAPHVSRSRATATCRPWSLQRTSQHLRDDDLDVCLSLISTHGCGKRSEFRRLGTLHFLFAGNAKDVVGHERPTRASPALTKVPPWTRKCLP